MSREALVPGKVSNMRLLSFLLVALLCCDAANVPLLAHPGGHAQEDTADESHDAEVAGIREWQLANGQGSRRGAFLSVREDRVWLLTDGGSVEALRQGDLRPRDQAWVRERLEEIARLNHRQPSTVLAQQLPKAPADRPGRETAGDAERRDAGLGDSKATDARAQDAVDAPARARTQSHLSTTTAPMAVVRNDSRCRRIRRGDRDADRVRVVRRAKVDGDAVDGATAPRREAPQRPGPALQRGGHGSKYLPGRWIAVAEGGGGRCGGYCGTFPQIFSSNWYMPGSCS